MTPDQLRDLNQFVNNTNRFVPPDVDTHEARSPNIAFIRVSNSFWRRVPVLQPRMDSGLLPPGRDGADRMIPLRLPNRGRGAQRIFVSWPNFRNFVSQQFDALRRAKAEYNTRLFQLVELYLDADQPSEAAWSHYLVAKEECETFRLQAENGFQYLYNQVPRDLRGSVPSPDQA